MDATLCTVDDVSTPEATPAVGRREYLAGVRPVVGASLACGLLLLVCSWFAISNGSLWPTRDVGNADPVRIDGPPAADATAGRAPAARIAKVTTNSPSARIDAPRPAGSPTTPGRIDPERAATQAPAPSSPAAPTRPAAASPTPAAPPADAPIVTVQTPQLPAPLDGLPAVSVPVPPVPVPELPVTPPSLPKVPVVSDATSSLGLP